MVDPLASLPSNVPDAVRVELLHQLRLLAPESDYAAARVGVLAPEETKVAIENMKSDVFSKKYSRKTLSEYIDGLPDKPDGWVEVGAVASDLQPLKVGRIMETWYAKRKTDVSCKSFAKAEFEFRC